MVFGSTIFKPREERQNVLLSARVRGNGSWFDAQVCNLSSRGMLLEAGATVARGDILEVRRGPICVVARVMWADGRRFGVRSQDRICRDDLISADNFKPRLTDTGVQIERRSKPRLDRTDYDQSKHQAALLQFVGIAGSAIVGASLIAAVVWELLSTTSNSLIAALG